MDDLMDRLRGVTGGKLDYTNTPNSLRLAAADRIEQLEEKLLSATMDGYDMAKHEYRDRIEELEAKLEKVTTELKMLIDVSTLMQSSAFYDKRKYQSAITDTIWQQWSKQLKFSKGTIAKLKGQNDE